VSDFITKFVSKSCVVSRMSLPDRRDAVQPWAYQPFRASCGVQTSRAATIRRSSLGREL
jgi:hypothetical protein